MKVNAHEIVHRKLVSGCVLLQYQWKLWCSRVFCPPNNQLQTNRHNNVNSLKNAEKISKHKKREKKANS